MSDLQKMKEVLQTYIDYSMMYGRFPGRPVAKIVYLLIGGCSGEQPYIRKPQSIFVVATPFPEYEKNCLCCGGGCGRGYFFKVM